MASVNVLIYQMVVKWHGLQQINNKIYFAVWSDLIVFHWGKK